MNRRRAALLSVLSGASAAWTPASALPSGATPATWMKSDTGLYKDAAKTTPATADDDLVYTWDNIVTGNDFVQATEGLRPKLKIVGGAHFVRFDGSDDLMDVAIVTDASQTLFFVVKKNSAPSGITKIMFSFGGAAGARMFSDSRVFSGVYGYGQNQAAANVEIGGTVTNWNAVSLVYASAADCKIRLNGGTAVAFDPNDAYSTGEFIRIGAVFDGDYLEVLRYTSALNDADRAVVEAYLAGRIANPT